MVTDITTTAQNFPVNREDESEPGKSKFMGVFGNNALFIIPTNGPDAGVPRCFATGPMECELTGPWHTEDHCLLIAVQHPGEVHGARGFPGVDQPMDIRDREVSIMGRDGNLFTQHRTVPLGSNFPDNQSGAIPRPCVVCIRRA
jgi:secreted PhoX family phosphatase